MFHRATVGAHTPLLSLPVTNVIGPLELPLLEPPLLLLPPPQAASSAPSSGHRSRLAQHRAREPSCEPSPPGIRRHRRKPFNLSPFRPPERDTPGPPRHRRRRTPPEGRPRTAAGRHTARPVIATRTRVRGRLPDRYGSRPRLRLRGRVQAFLLRCLISLSVEVLSPRHAIDSEAGGWPTTQEGAAHAWRSQRPPQSPW